MGEHEGRALQSESRRGEPCVRLSIIFAGTPAPPVEYYHAMNFPPFSSRRAAALAALLTILFPLTVRADEGMWLYNNPPKAQVQKTYGVTLSDGWLAHLQRASVKFVGIASGSFVSADGLVMTNHHVGADTLQKLSTPRHNYARDGFYARTRAEEAKAPDLELDVLESITPVTDRVNAAVTPSMTPAEAFRARRRAVAQIEQASQAKTGLKSQVVTLFGGARYDLYAYKTYTDVRLVMAPDANAAFYGGDPDNFEYPRYDLDICFFRAYENGKPARITDYLTWSKAGVKDGDPVFVSGNPGRTARLNTVADLKTQRDVFLPALLNALRRREVLLTSWGARLPENARVADDALFGTQNGRKKQTGSLQALQDPAFLAAKQARETALRAKVAADPKLQAAYGDAWDQADRADTASRAELARFGLLADGFSLRSRLYEIAQTLVLRAEEDQKPNDERLPGYTDSARASLDLDLFSPAPVYSNLEKLTLADSLAQMAETLGADNPIVTQVLAGQSPTERAAALVNGTALAAVDARKKLAAGGLAAVEASQDPMIVLARQLDPTYRALRKAHEADVESVDLAADAKIARAQLAVSDPGTVYPDATGTLRLSYGKVTGYTEAGQAVPAFTFLGGLYPYAAAHENKPPYQISAPWLAAKDKLAPHTPFNFVSTADIIGGNSGSPVVDKNGDLVGIIFDGNIQSLALDYAYSDTQARAVSVDARAIIESLRHVYGEDALADELLSGHAQ